MATSRTLTVFEKYYLVISYEGLEMEQLTPHHLHLDTLGVPRPSPWKKGQFDTRPGTNLTICNKVVERWVTPLNIWNAMKEKNIIGSLKLMLIDCADVILFGATTAYGATKISIILSTKNNERTAFEFTPQYEDLRKKMVAGKAYFELFPVYHTRTLLTQLLESSKFMGAKNSRDLQLIIQLSQPKGAMDNYVSPLADHLAYGPRIDQGSNGVGLRTETIPEPAKEEDQWEFDDSLFMEMDMRLTAAEQLALLGIPKTTEPETDEKQSEGGSTVHEKPVTEASSPDDTFKESTECCSAIICEATGQQAKDKPSKQWRKRLITLTLDEDEDYVIIKKSHACAKCRNMAE
jgi:hypothetical protein